MRVPLFDLRRLLSEHKPALLSSLSDSIDSASFILGEDVSLFEEEFARDIRSSYCIGASSGTDALLAILMALDIESGSDVIVIGLAPNDWSDGQIQRKRNERLETRPCH